MVEFTPRGLSPNSLNKPISQDRSGKNTEENKTALLMCGEKILLGESGTIKEERSKLANNILS